MYVLDITGSPPLARGPARGSGCLRMWTQQLGGRAHVASSLAHSPVVFGRVSSEPTQSDRHRSYNSVVLVEPGADGDRNWVAREDGGAAWLFFPGFEPTIQDVVTRAVTYLPRFRNDDNDDWVIRHRMRSPRGILYCDGTVFLYSFVAGTTNRTYGSYPPVFTAAILRPGDAKWTLVHKLLDLPASHHSCAAYHAGKVLVQLGGRLLLVRPDAGLLQTRQHHHQHRQARDDLGLLGLISTAPEPNGSGTTP